MKSSLKSETTQFHLRQNMITHSRRINKPTLYYQYQIGTIIFPTENHYIYDPCIATRSS